ncbi:unnamed protein product [Peniophora sp. CBMAI 1063]|nr:unnamed protein product [Peniophora sp. CBMAI 1063]
MSAQTSHAILDIPKAMILLAHGKKSDAFRHRMLAEVDMACAMGVRVSRAADEIHSFCNVQAQAFYYNDDSRRTQLLKELNPLKRVTASLLNDVAVYTSAVFDHAGGNFSLETPAALLFGTPRYRDVKKFLPKPLVTPDDEAVLRRERLEAQTKAAAQGTSSKGASGSKKRPAPDSAEDQEPTKRQRKDAPTSRCLRRSARKLVTGAAPVKAELTEMAVDPTPTLIAHFNELGAARGDDWETLLRWHNLPLPAQLNAFTFAATLVKAFADMKAARQDDIERSLARTQELESALAVERDDKTAAQRKAVEMEARAVESEKRATESQKDYERERSRRQDEEGDMEWVAEQIAPLSRFLFKWPPAKEGPVSASSSRR